VVNPSVVELVDVEAGAATTSVFVSVKVCVPCVAAADVEPVALSLHIHRTCSASQTTTAKTTERRSEAIAQRPHQPAGDAPLLGPRRAAHDGAPRARCGGRL